MGIDAHGLPTYPGASSRVMSVAPTNHLPAAGRHRGRTGGGLVLTVSGWHALQQELATRRARKEQEIAERLREARGFGEASVNDEYLAIQEEEAVLEAGIAGLEQLLDTAVILDEVEPSGDVVKVGTLVTVEGLNERGPATFEVVGSHQAARPEVISAGSPVGNALTGRAAGETVEVELPHGHQRKLRVVAITPAGG
jgi:transcription elongation factor GreA